MKEQENTTLEVILDTVKIAMLVAFAVVMVWCFVGAYRKAPPPAVKEKTKFTFEEPQDWADDSTKTLGKVLYLRSVYETKDCAESE